MNRQPEEEKKDSDDEAQEDQIGVASSQGTPEEEESGEELINDNMINDYKPIPELDRYEEEGLDDEQDFEDMDIEQRRKAEEEIDRRRRINLDDRRVPQALHDLSEPEEMVIERDFMEERFEEEDTDVLEEEKYLNIEECRGKLNEWIKDDRTSTILTNYRIMD